MFDTIAGLPVHPLVVHAVVVLLPLAALVTVVVSLRRGWRERLAWAVVALNALVLGLTFVATQSGEALEARLTGVDVSEHESWGDRLPFVAGALLVVSVLTAVGRRSTRLGPLVVVLSIVSAAVTVFFTLRTGHTGAVAVWGGIVATP